MLCNCGLRRLKAFSSILESLQEVKFKLARKPCTPSDQIYVTCSAKQHNMSMSRLQMLTSRPIEQEQEDGPSREMSKHLHNTELTEMQDLYHKYIIEENLESDVPLDDAKIVDQNPKTADVLRSKTKTKQRSKTSPHYPLSGLGTEQKMFTSSFEKSEKLLKSLNVPTGELCHYPDVQEMSEEEICSCLDRLKEVGIHVIFSLFLIQRISAELILEKTAKRAPLPHTKNWFKLRNGKYRLTSLQAVDLYLQLCNQLDDPRLDLYSFVDSLAAVNIYEHLNTIVSKVEQLRSLGATPQDIVSNLTLLKGCNLFKAKIKVYKNLFPYNKPAFPVNLFLSKTMTEFREKLQVGQDVSLIANLLDVTPIDFLMCWGFKPISTNSLVYKIHMCLKAGIHKQEIFNNISMINRLSLNKSKAVMESVLKSGQPVSLFELKALEDTVDFKEKCEDQKDWTSEEPGDASPLNATKVSLKSAPVRKSLVKATKKKSYQSVESSKIWRMEVFRLIAHLLGLTSKARQAMFKANISVDSTQIQDITQNLDHLLSNLKFSKEQISACPLVLAHPHKNLCVMTQEIEFKLSQHFAWSSAMPASCETVESSSSLPPAPPPALNTRVLPPCSSSSLLSLSPGADLSSTRGQRSSFKKVSMKGSRVYRRSEYSYLLTDPLTHLNLLQYFLEKEAGFSVVPTNSVVLGH